MDMNTGYLLAGAKRGALLGVVDYVIDNVVMPMGQRTGTLGAYFVAGFGFFIKSALATNENVMLGGINF